ncbi:MAG TPA: peptide chain release factor-like protein [Phycisphaerae bacterium]|nr:peptide chain release factor-like protein [Phycisphaerae bacterium]
MAASRDQHLTMSDDRLLAECTVETYRASGPGGQHRNKRDSAVRLTHRPTGVSATATERRSQHENRRVAVRRLRKAIALRVRAPADATAPAAGALAEALADATLRSSASLRSTSPRWPRVSQKSETYLVAAAQVLDRLEAAEGKVSDVATALGVSTASLVKFLSLDTDLWTEANRIRRRFGQKPLR